jgi:hypothetical protein
MEGATAKALRRIRLEKPECRRERGTTTAAARERRIQGSAAPGPLAKSGLGARHPVLCVCPRHAQGDLHHGCVGQEVFAVFSLLPGMQAPDGFSRAPLFCSTAPQASPPRSAASRAISRCRAANRTGNDTLPRRQLAHGHRHRGAADRAAGERRRGHDLHAILRW